MKQGINPWACGHNSGAVSSRAQEAGYDEGQWGEAASCSSCKSRAFWGTSLKVMLFPLREGSQNIIARAKDQTCYSKIDQVNLEVGGTGVLPLKPNLGEVSVHKQLWKCKNWITASTYLYLLHRVQIKRDWRDVCHA